MPFIAHIKTNPKRSVRKKLAAQKIRAGESFSGSMTILQRDSQVAEALSSAISGWWFRPPFHPPKIWLSG
jgi:hypothetical protein